MSHKSRVAQLQDDTLAGPSQDALGLSDSSVGDDPSGSWYSIYDGDAPLVVRTCVCGGNVYYYPSEELTPEASQHKGHSANVFGSQGSIIEEMDTWIASYSQRHAGSGDNLDADYSTFGDDLEPRSDVESLSDVERSEAYAASGDEFCVYDPLREVYNLQVNDDDPPRLLHFCPRRAFHRWDQTKFDATRSTLDEILAAATRRVIGVVSKDRSADAIEVMERSSSPSLGVKLRDLTLRDQSVYEKGVKKLRLARWRKTEVKARKRFGLSGAFNETFDETTNHGGPGANLRTRSTSCVPIVEPGRSLLISEQHNKEALKAT
ncbi:hypothetical protein EDD85DRAFT_798119 [Armillaria nabsnona]|nr:hypothetical protein EDD85DRAFT_798119 [Armillaria nabsnona]